MAIFLRRSEKTFFPWNAPEILLDTNFRPKIPQSLTSPSISEQETHRIPIKVYTVRKPETSREHFIRFWYSYGAHMRPRDSRVWAKYEKWRFFTKRPEIGHIPRIWPKNAKIWPKKSKFQKKVILLFFCHLKTVFGMLVRFSDA